MNIIPEQDTTGHIAKAHEYLYLVGLNDRSAIHALMAVALELRRMNDLKERECSPTYLLS